jgi:HPt (histidine-containing phosphotransfer) domain-containing protein
MLSSLPFSFSDVGSAVRLMNPVPMHPMCDSRKKSLNSLLPTLETDLLVENFISNLHVDAEGFLNDHELEAIRSRGNNYEKVRELFSILKGKGNAAFDRLCSVLVSAGYGHWAKELLERASLPCEGVQDSLSMPLDKLNAILSCKKEIFLPLERKLHSQFVDLTAAFEGYVFQLSDLKFRIFRRHCSGFLQVQRTGPFAPPPYLPEEKGKLLDMLNKEWNFIDIRLFDDLVQRSDQQSLQQDTMVYKQSLGVFSLQKLSQLERSIQEVKDSLEGAEDGQILAAILSKDPTLKEIFKIKDFLVNDLHLEDAKFLGFDSGCTVVFFKIALGSSGNFHHLGMGLLASLHVLVEISVCRVLLLGFWAIEVSSASLYPLPKLVCWYIDTLYLRVPIYGINLHV